MHAGQIATALLAWLDSSPALWLARGDYRHASEGEQTTGINYANEMVVRHGADLMQTIHSSFTKMPKQGGVRPLSHTRVYKVGEASRVPSSQAHTSWLRGKSKTDACLKLQHKLSAGLCKNSNTQFHLPAHIRCVLAGPSIPSAALRELGMSFWTCFWRIPNLNFVISPGYQQWRLSTPTWTPQAVTTPLCTRMTRNSHSSSSLHPASPASPASSCSKPPASPAELQQKKRRRGRARNEATVHVVKKNRGWKPTTARGTECTTSTTPLDALRTVLPAFPDDTKLTKIETLRFAPQLHLGAFRDHPDRRPATEQAQRPFAAAPGTKLHGRSAQPQRWLLLLAIRRILLVFLPSYCTSDPDSPAAMDDFGYLQTDVVLQLPQLRACHLLTWLKHSHVCIVCRSV